MSNFGTTSFTVTPATGSCREALIAQITDALGGEITNESLHNILISLIECLNNTSTGTGDSDGVITGITISGNLVTVTRSAGLGTITAAVDISGNSTIVTINGNVTALDTRITTNEGDIAAITAALTPLLDSVVVDPSLLGNGTVGNELSVKLGAEADNIVVRGANGGLYVPPPGLSVNVVEYLADNLARLALVSPLQEVIYTVLDSDGNGLRESYTWNGTDWILLRGPVVSAPGNMLIYTDGNMLTKADGLGINYVLAGNVATVIIPNGVMPDRIRINESYASIGNSETFYVKIVDNGGVVNESLATFYPFDATVIERDLLSGTLPDNSGSTFRYESGNVALNSRASKDIVEINTISNYILYRFTNLGTDTKWSILLT
jgi:hypothetical protein